MKINLKTAIAGSIAAAMLVATPAFAKWPDDKNVVIVINWPPGASIDLVGRLIADGLGKKYPSGRFIVENRAGATGNIGQAYVAKAAPDGYTWLLTTPGPAANNALTFSALPYDPIKEFAGVTQVTSDTMGITINKKRRPELHTAKGFLDFAKANKGKLQVGHPGAGTYAHMILLAMQDQLNTEFNLVPYKGGTEMVTDLMSGNIDAIMNFTGPYFGQYETNDFAAIAVIRDDRSSFLKDVPTLKEAGVNFSAAPWTLMQAPKGVPKEIIAEMSKSVNDILKSKEVSDKIYGMKIEPAPTTPEAADKLVQAEQDKWRAVIKKYNIRAD